MFTELNELLDASPQRPETVRRRTGGRERGRCGGGEGPARCLPGIVVRAVLAAGRAARCMLGGAGPCQAAAAGGWDGGGGLGLSRGGERPPGPSLRPGPGSPPPLTALAPVSEGPGPVPAAFGVSMRWWLPCRG